MKKCSGPCGKFKPRTDFHRNRRTYDGRGAYCKDCFRHYIRIRRGALLDPGDYERLLMGQHGVCAICGGGPGGGRSQTQFDVDHDHVTGQVRGLLCSACNRLVGWVEKHGELLPKIRGYLGQLV